MHKGGAKIDLERRTIEVFGTRARQSLSKTDAREIIRNTTGFFAVLDQWARKELSESRP